MEQVLRCLRRLRRNAAIWVLALALATTAFFQARNLSLRDEGSYPVWTYYSQPASERPTLISSWRARPLSMHLAGQVISLSEDEVAKVAQARARAASGQPASIASKLLSEADFFYPGDGVAFGISLWTAAWLLAANIMMVLTVGPPAILYLLGTAAALSYCYTFGIQSNNGMMPWDMPALFFSCALVGLWIRRRPFWLAALIPFAVLFKETLLVFVVFLLFSRSWEARRRWGSAAAVFLSALALRALVTANAGGDAELWDGIRLLDNLEQLVELRLNHPVFINGGLLLAFLLAPGKSPELAPLRWICGIFIGVMLLYGDIMEYRIWLELVPVALCGLSCSLAYPGSSPSPR
jgi:hypothetical protein